MGSDGKHVGKSTSWNVKGEMGRKYWNTDFMVTPCINNTEPSFITNWCT